VDDRARISVPTKFNLPVVSDLTRAEPVTEAEIALVLGVLGNKLLNILSSESRE